MYRLETGVLQRGHRPGGSRWRPGTWRWLVILGTATTAALLAVGSAAAVTPSAVVATISLPRGFVALDEVDAAGSVWSLAADGQGGYLYRIDPATNAIVSEIDLPPGTPTGDSLLRGAMVVAAGSLWVAATFRDQVWRIDPSTGRIVRRIATGRYPAFLAAGGGSVWVAQDEAGSVARIDPGTNAVVATIPVGWQGPAGVDQPLAVTWDEAGHRVLVTLPHTHRVAVINGSTQRVRTLSVAPAAACGPAIAVPGGFWLDDTPCSVNMFHWSNHAAAVTAQIAPAPGLNANLGGVAEGPVLYTGESYCGPTVCRRGTIVKRDASTGAVLTTRRSGLTFAALPSIASGDLWATDFGGLLTRVAHF